MKSVRLILFVILSLFILYVKLATVSTTPATAPIPNAAPAPVSAVQPAATVSAPIQVPSTEPAATPDSGVPAKVLQVLQIVRSTGQPPDGYVGGRVFENREGRLAPGGDYREFDVDPHNGNRNAERIIVDWNTKKAWYTADHYQTFTPLP
jgi:ribonuclease T1